MRPPCERCNTPIATKPRHVKGVTPQPPAGHRWHGGYGLCDRCHGERRRRKEGMLPRAAANSRRGCTIEKQLAGTCTCKTCKWARDDHESPLDAGQAVNRGGIARWAS